MRKPWFTARRILGTILSLALTVSLWLFYKPEIGEGVTKSGLLALRPGIPEAQVIQLIGEPLSRRQAPPPRFGEWSWHYGKQGLLGLGKGTEIWVTIKNGRLVAAAAERYDLGIWWCNESECPVVWNEEEFDRLPVH